MTLLGEEKRNARGTREEYGDYGAGGEGGEGMKPRTTEEKKREKREKEREIEERRETGSDKYSKVPKNKRERGSWRSAMGASHAAPIGKGSTVS